MSKATRKLVIDFPAEVRDELDRLKLSTGKSVKQLILDAIEEAYQIKPAE